MKTFLTFLAVLAVSVLATALGSGRVDAGSLLLAAGTAALLSAAFTDRQPRPRLALDPVSRPAPAPPLEARCVPCAATAS